MLGMSGNGRFARKACLQVLLSIDTFLAILAMQASHPLLAYYVVSKQGMVAKQVVTNSYLLRTSKI